MFFGGFGVVCCFWCWWVGFVGHLLFVCLPVALLVLYVCFGSGSLFCGSSSTVWDGMAFVPIWWNKVQWMRNLHYYSSKTDHEADRLWECALETAKICRMDKRWKQVYNHDEDTWDDEICFHVQLP